VLKVRPRRAGECGGLTLGTKRQSWRRAEPIIIEFGSSLARLYEDRPAEGRAFSELGVAKAAE
jgi:hypothetical protein